MSRPEYPIKISHDRGYKLFVRDDGDSAYLELFHLLLEDRLEAEALTIHNKKHKVLRAEYKGRIFIIKMDFERPKYLESRLWLFFYGPFYSKQMKAVNRAVNQGCSAVPVIYLVAEKTGGFIPDESIVIMEYIKSVKAVTDESIKKHGADIARAVSELHKHGLAWGDCNPANFIFAEEGLKIIDLSWPGFSFIGRAQDIFSLKNHYGLALPVNDTLTKVALIYIKIKKRLRAWSRKARGKPPKGGW